MVSRERLGRGELQQLIRELAQREYAIPGSARRRGAALERDHCQTASIPRHVSLQCEQSNSELLWPEARWCNRRARGYEARGDVKPFPEWTFGATYSPKIKLDAKNGDAEVNLTAIGLSVVPYRNASIEGFALAREVALGAAWQASPRTLLSIKVAHLDWSDALRSVTVTVSDPANPAAPAQITSR